MPARTTKIRHDEQTRTKIKVAQIINRLHRHLMGEIELTPAQVSSAKTLLAKALPDLTATTMEVTGNPLGTLYERVTGKPSDLVEEDGDGASVH